MRILLAAVMMSAAMAAAHAQSSSSGGGSSGGGSSGSGGMGGSSGSARTESAPSGTLRQDGTGLGSNPRSDLGQSETQRGLTAPGSSGRPGAGGLRGDDQSARVPDECIGPVTDPSCPTAGAPTGTGLGDRGIGQGRRDRYGPEDSPVKGGPSFERGPTGLPVNPPR